MALAPGIQFGIGVPATTVRALALQGHGPGLAFDLQQLALMLPFLAACSAIPNSQTACFGKTPAWALLWFEYSGFSKPRSHYLSSITFAFVATHNHFVLDRGGKVFNRTAPVIKLPEGATEEAHLALLGLLNSSTACFWMKQVFHNKGASGRRVALRSGMISMR